MRMRTKNELRALLKQKRSVQTKEERQARDGALVEQIAASSELLEASALLLYAPIGEEINLLPLVRVARKRGIPVAFPRCDTATQTMQFYILKPDARLAPGAYGIPEPPSDAPLCEPDEKALCLLPALGYDLHGGRLGYGKGYYDRFLASFPGIAAGVCYEDFLLKQVPTEPHDRPVSLLFTDRGRRRIGQALPGERKAGDNGKGRKTSRLSAVLSSIRYRLTGDRRDRAELPAVADEKASAPMRPMHAPMILAAVIFALLPLCSLLGTYLGNRDNEYVVMILLEILLFVIPAVLYSKLCRQGLASRLRLRMIRPDQLWFLICMLVVMISGGMLCEILTGGISSLVGNFTLYDTFVARVGGGGMSVLYVLLSYCLLPAFCEELIFRGLLCAEYESRGVLVSVTVSAALFSMLHFSFSLFVTYLVLGMLLACAMYSTRSFFAPVLLHLLYNVFCIFGQPYLSAFYVYAGSSEIFIFCLIVLFLLFGAFAAGEARKLYHKYARTGLDSSYTVPLTVRDYPARLWSTVRTPAAIVCVVIWLVASILGGR